MKKSILLFLFLLLALGKSAPAATQPQTLGGLGPEAVSKLHPVGRLEGSHRLKLAIGLASRDEPGLDALIHDLYDPASPNYRHFLTPGSSRKGLARLNRNTTP